MARHDRSTSSPSTFGKYTDRVARITATLGHMPVRAVKAEHIARWQSELLKSGLASGTVGDVRITLRQVLEQAVIHELTPANVVDRVAAPKVVRASKRALNSGDARRLVDAAATDRLGAAVALLFVQGWRVSEVLGLAWEDLDFDRSTATVRRAAVYVDDVGMVLGPTKNTGATGVHHLSAGVIEMLRARRKAQMAEQLACTTPWIQHTYEGRPVSLVFTKADGGIVTRQKVAKAVTRAAERVGIDPVGVADAHRAPNRCDRALLGGRPRPQRHRALRRPRRRDDHRRLREVPRRTSEANRRSRRIDARPSLAAKR